MDVFDFVTHRAPAPADAAEFVAFADWTAAERSRLRGLGTLESLPPGTVLIDAGSDDRVLYIVVSGELEVVRGGQRRAVLRPGDLVGEVAFIDGRPRSAAVRALSAAQVQCIRPADVEALAARDSAVALRFVWEVARILAARLRGVWR